MTISFIIICLRLHINSIRYTVFKLEKLIKTHKIFNQD